MVMTSLGSSPRELDGYSWIGEFQNFIKKFDSGYNSQNEVEIEELRKRGCKNNVAKSIRNVEFHTFNH